MFGAIENTLLLALTQGPVATIETQALPSLFRTPLIRQKAISKLETIRDSAIRPIKLRESTYDNRLEEKRFTREAFYDLVWSKPAIKLAPELGISDAAITKICRRYRIPKPGVGDWNLIAAGHSIKKPKLPPVKEGERDQIVIWPQEKHDRPLVRTLPPEVLQLIEKEKLPEYRIAVPELLEGAHPVLRRMHRLLKQANPDIYGEAYTSIEYPATPPDSFGRFRKFPETIAEDLRRALQSTNAAWKPCEGCQQLHLCNYQRRASFTSFEGTYNATAN